MGVGVVARLSAYVSSDVLTGGMGAAVVVVVMNQGGVGHRGLCVQRRGGDRGRAAGEPEKLHQAGRVDDAPKASFAPPSPPGLLKSRLMTSSSSSSPCSCASLLRPLPSHVSTDASFSSC